MATVAKNSMEHLSRVTTAEMLKYFAIKYGMTTELESQWVMGHNRALKRWLRLYKAW